MLFTHAAPRGEYSSWQWTPKCVVTLLFWRLILWPPHWFCSLNIVPCSELRLLIFGQSMGSWCLTCWIGRTNLSLHGKRQPDMLGTCSTYCNVFGDSCKADDLNRYQLKRLLWVQFQVGDSTTNAGFHLFPYIYIISVGDLIVMYFRQIRSMKPPGCVLYH